MTFWNEFESSLDSKGVSTTRTDLTFLSGSVLFCASFATSDVRRKPEAQLTW
jgi:hypothetical protein